MARQGDTKQARSVKADFDDESFSTAHGGAVLFEQAIRRTGLRKVAGKALGKRAGVYSTEGIVLQVIAGLLCGGKGFQASSVFSQDEELAKIFSIKEAASDSTIYRAMCGFAGLEQRCFDDCYVERGPELAASDILGEEKKQSKSRRLVPEEPEAMGEEHAGRLHDLITSMAKRINQFLPHRVMNLHGFLPIFGDGTDIEVSGSRFDAAEKNKDGNACLRMMSVMAGPLVMGLSVLKGNTDEGKSLPSLLEKSASTIKEMAQKRPVLALLDAAFAEKDVIEKLDSKAWKYIVCANQYRSLLTRLAEEQPEWQWHATGPDATRGWAESAVMVMTHQPEGWKHPVTVVVRRYRKEGELCWRYSFLYTNLAVKDLPYKHIKKHGFASFIWQLYNTKQGRENNFKTLLTDMGQHHPPSGRLGATEAFAHLAAVAANIHTFIAYRVVPKKDRGIRHWRFLRDYVLIAGRVVIQSGRRLFVWLSGGGLPSERKRRFLEAQAALGST